MEEWEHVCRLLIVDDDVVIRRLYRRLLERHAPGACEITEAADAASCLVALRARQFDCILLDYNLPDMTGLELLTHAAIDSELSCAIVLITGQGDEAIAVASMKRGVQDYLVKDQVNANSLWRAVTTAMTQVALRHRATQDAARQRQLEDELRQSQKLEALGQLTAGIAHDFNNALQGLMTYLELLFDEVSDRPMAHDYLQCMLRVIDRSSELTQCLLSFGRRQLLNPIDLDLASFISEIRTLLRHTLNPQIAVEVTVEAGLRPIRADATHLQSALLNLAINARDAMPSGGRLRIEASSSKMAKPYAVINVIDTGCGMSPETLQRAREPFFTTKGQKGTGLGLSMVHGFAKQSGGDLQIESALGIGTSVQLLLPQVCVAGAARRRGTPADLPHREEAIINVSKSRT